MTEFVVGENGVLSWSSPVPPNGVILYYNVIIYTADSGQLVTRVEELDILTIDVSSYGEINMDYNVTVRANRGVFQFYICSNSKLSGQFTPWLTVSISFGVLTCVCEQYTTREKQSIMHQVYKLHPLCTYVQCPAMSMHCRCRDGCISCPCQRLSAYITNIHYQSCLHLCHAQVQAVTSVGGGDFSSPVTVSLREPSPDSNSGPPVTVIAVAVIVVVIVLLAVIVTCLGAYICW